MFNLAWDQTGQKLYETGVDRAVLYPQVNGTYPKGVAWNGVSNITESPSGAEPTAVWADNQKYLNMISAEEYGASIEAYTYPDEFEECDGSVEVAPGVYAGQQDRKTFGLSYRSLIGNDTEGTSHGYKLHLIYGALAAPSEKAHNTVNDSAEAGTMSWELSTTPVSIATQINGKTLKPTATLTVDSTKTDATKLAELESILYGKAATSVDANDAVEARLPLPDEVIALVGAVAAG